MPLVQVRYKKPATKETQKLLKGLDPSFMRWNNSFHCRSASSQVFDWHAQGHFISGNVCIQNINCISLYIYIHSHTLYRIFLTPDVLQTNINDLKESWNHKSRGFSWRSWSFATWIDSLSGEEDDQSKSGTSKFHAPGHQSHQEVHDSDWGVAWL